jgi:hypothetical protein
MSESCSSRYAVALVQRPWDARLARKLITPLKDTWVTPNYLTTVRRCLSGIAARLGDRVFRRHRRALEPRAAGAPEPL